MTPTPLEWAHLCIGECQYFYPEYWRSTFTRDAYQRCLENCGGLPARQPATGEPQATWPADLVREVGEDIAPALDAVAGAVRGAHQAIQLDLLLLVVGALAVAYTVKKIVP